MGITAKNRQTRFYARLLVIFPSRYRKRYQQPMVQTFDDMLEENSSLSGKVVVWLRTLIDLPMSALKEHLTNEGDYIMTRKMQILFGSVVVLLLLANGFSWWFGNLHSRRTSGVEKVTVAELADAMQGDHFYSTYGNTTVLFHGKVVALQQKGKVALVSFETGASYSLTCQFPRVEQIHKGENISVAAPGGTAERQPHGVLLHDCLID